MCLLRGISLSKQLKNKNKKKVDKLSEISFEYHCENELCGNKKITSIKLYRMSLPEIYFLFFFLSLRMI